MNLKVIAVYLKESQHEYIISLNTGFAQTKNNFMFEQVESESEIAKHYGIKSFPTFLILKNEKVVSVIEGKLLFNDLKEKLLNTTYIRMESN